MIPFLIVLVISLTIALAYCVFTMNSLAGVAEDEPTFRDIEMAVALRFRQIRGGLKENPGDYIYCTYRCWPEQLGWRFRQNMGAKEGKGQGLAWPGYPGIIEAIQAGLHDDDIEETWHDAAGAAYWYRWHKDYGTPD